MSTMITGLAGLKAEKARRVAEAEARERPRANYFNWKFNKNKEDKNVVYMRFLQEFDKDIEGYSEERGLPLMVVEHQAPGVEGFKRRATCTAETEGQCYPCERHPEDKKLGWGQKSNFYIWALVDYNDGDGVKPVVISRSFGSSFVEDLIIEVESDDENRITNKMWKVTKSGAGKSTAWKLREDKKTPLLDDSDIELIDLKEAVLRSIPYDEQPAYFGAVYKDGDPSGNDDDDESAPAPAKTVLPEKQATGELEW